MASTRVRRLAAGFVLCLAVTAALMCASASAQAAAKSADVVLLGGRIYTGDAQHGRAEALAVRDGRIVAVGSDRSVRALVGALTRVIRLRGRLVTPSFIDAHCHPDKATADLFELSLLSATGLAEVQDSLQAFATAHPELPAIIGTGWPMSFYDGLGPQKEWLDSVVSDRPVFIMDVSLHLAWLNSKALEIAGITRDTPNPAGGEIVHDPVTGEPWGVLKDEAAWAAQALVAAPYTVDQFAQALTYYQNDIALPFGITTVGSAATVSDDNSVRAWEALDRDGRLKLRVRQAVSVNPASAAEDLLHAVDLRSEVAGGRYRVTQAKFFLDGVLEVHTGWVKEPYADMPDWSGEPYWPNRAQLDAASVRASRLGLQLQYHAIGDAAVAQAVDTIAATRKVVGSLRNSPLVAHLELADQDDILRMADVGAVAVMQPYWFMKNSWFPYQEPVLGTERANMQYPMESLFKAGIRVASGSDYSALATAPNPLIGIQIGVAREFPGQTVPGDVLWPEQRATRRQMVDSFTVNAARALGLSRVTGSLEEGKSADLVILSKDIFSVPVEQISESRVVLTISQGKVVYRR
ncbi:MAG: amidohydrolase [Actinomycetes bacterium]